MQLLNLLRQRRRDRSEPSVWNRLWLWLWRWRGKPNVERAEEVEAQLSDGETDE